MEQLLTGPLTGIAQAIRREQVSAREVMEATLRQVEAVNPALNAVVTLAADQALAQAEAADRAQARGDDLGALHGVPMTIKDSLDTAGMRSTWGTPGRARYVPGKDATVVARLKKAGAILIGKSNTPELTLSYETNNPIFGRSNNPYDLARTPGGSSGGAAAIIAAAAVPFDIGSDTGGSIRWPAHCCGIAGLKPTAGRVPRSGHAISEVGWLNGLTHLGPMARYVSDLAYLLPLISGPDGRDPQIQPVPLGDPEQVKLPGLRLSFHSDNGIRAADPATDQVVRAAARSLEEAGVIVMEERPPGIEQSLDLLARLMRGPDGAAWLRRILAASGTSMAETSLDRYADLESGPAEEMVAVIEAWHRFQGRMLAYLERVDAILSPVNACPALLHGTFSGENYPGFGYTMTYNLTGWPAAVVRAGSSPEGLPIGVQVIARPWRDDVALAVADYLEHSLGGWRRPPR